MKDFRDAAEMLTRAGGGFQVADAAALTALVLSHVDKPESYALACTRAAEVAAQQRGAVSRQVEIVRQTLTSC
jgi:3-deoxy-D-manno-octulosonic-acid transferase